MSRRVESQTKHAERALVKLRRAALALAKAIRELGEDEAQEAEIRLMRAADGWAAAQERDYIENTEREP